MTFPRNALTRRSFCLASLGTAGAALVGAPPAGAATFINVGSGAPGGTFFPVGAAVVNAISANMPNVRAQVQQTGGSHENIQLVARARAEYGLSVADVLSMAYNGRDDKRYPQPLRTLRGLASLFPTHVHILMRADSGVRTVKDLRGKRITVGAAGGGTESNARAILGAAGLSFSDLRVEYLSANDSADAIRDRRLDGMFFTTGLGASALRELAGGVDMVFVPVPADLIAAVGDGAYAVGEVPAGTYPVQGLPAPTAVIWTQLFTDERVPAEQVRAVMAAIFADLATFRTGHAALRAVDIENAARGMPIPFHDGAKLFFAERGIKVG